MPQWRIKLNRSRCRVDLEKDQLIGHPVVNAGPKGPQTMSVSAISIPEHLPATTYHPDHSRKISAP